MGCDIHSFAEVKRNGDWHRIIGRIFPGDGMSAEPFGWRQYGMFGFLADVRNVSFVPCITGKRRGWPSDSAEEPDWNNHSFQYISLRELIDFDYENSFEDRRGEKEIAPRFFDGSADMGEGNGTVVSFREFLGDGFFKDIEILKTLGDPENVRVVMSFDS